jgi:hypothetical protein
LLLARLSGVENGNGARLLGQGIDEKLELSARERLIE